MSTEKVAIEDNYKLHEEYLEHAGPIQDGRMAMPAKKFTSSEENRLYTKMDLRILPMLALLYLLSFMDRGNIGNARLVGLERDLNMDADDFAVALSIFFVGYTLLEVPSNLMLQKVRPSWWITFLTVSWGIIMTLMGVVQSYAGLVVCRFLLGVAEAGLFPGVVLLLTFWYPRDRLQRRVALFFSAATLAGSFSGLLAYGIGFMDGIAGYSGWRWIFILEGIATVVAGVVAFFVLVDLPASAKFLTEDEKAWVIYRKAAETGGAGESHKIKWKFVKAAFSDYQCWCGLGFTLGTLTPVYSIGLFTPTLINSFGTYTRPQVQLLTVPVYAAACIYVVITAIFADKMKTRFPFLLFAQVLMLIGFIINLTAAPNGVKFFGLFLVALGSYGSVPSGISWLTGNLAGQSKRGVGSAITLGLGSLGGVASSNIYRVTGRPRYFIGHGTNLGLVVLGIFSSCLYAYLLNRDNKRKEAWLEEQACLPEHERKVYTVEELQDLGDKSPEFTYTI